MKYEVEHKIGDKVKFLLEGKEFEGEVYIVDKNGTFFNPGVPSYDIMVTDEKFKNDNNKEGKCLVKHISQKILIK